MRLKKNVYLYGDKIKIEFYLRWCLFSMIYNLYRFLQSFYLVIYCVVPSCWKYIIYSTLLYKVRGHKWYLRSSLYLTLGYVSLQDIKPELWWNELYPKYITCTFFFKSVSNIPVYKKLNAYTSIQILEMQDII